MSKEENRNAHIFLVSSPQVAHSQGTPITYLFVVNASCPPEVRQRENWGLIERVDAPNREIVRGGLGDTRMHLDSRDATHEWKISVGNSNGLLYHEKMPEREGEDLDLTSMVKRIPASVLLIEDGLLDAFTSACRKANISYAVHVNEFPLCADCVEFGCDGCGKRSEVDKKGLEGTKFHLV